MELAVHIWSVLYGLVFLFYVVFCVLYLLDRRRRPGIRDANYRFLQDVRNKAQEGYWVAKVLLFTHWAIFSLGVVAVFFLIKKQ